MHVVDNHPSMCSILALILLLANLANTKIMRKTLKMIETLANGYSYESTRRELSNEYQHDRVLMVLKKNCVFVLWMKVASALEGLISDSSQLLHSGLQRDGMIIEKGHCTLLLS